MDKIRRKNGFTLIELIIVMAIFSLVGMIAFSMLSFSSKTFSKGENRSNVQFSIRMASEDITKRLRNAESVKILTSVPSPLDPDMTYVSVMDNTIKAVKGENSIDIFHSSSPDMNPTISFSKNPSVGNTVDFALECTYKGDNYNIKSNIAVLNMASWNTVLGSNSGSVIAYGPYKSEDGGSELTQIEKDAMEDRDNLDLKTSNPGAFKEDSDGSLILNYSNTSIVLPVSGSKGSTITWESSDVVIISTSGVVNKTGIGSDGKAVFVTAKITKGTAVYSKQFKIIVGRTAEELLNLTGLKANNLITRGTSFTINLTATGGSRSYNVVLTNITKKNFAGVSCSINGDKITITGTAPSGNKKTDSFTIQLIDKITNNSKVFSFSLETI